MNKFRFKFPTEKRIARVVKAARASGPAEVFIDAEGLVHIIVPGSQIPSVPEDLSDKI